MLKVSILIPCYNAEQWIAKAIDSALEQTYENKEIIVFDDGSTDNSLEIIKSFDGYIKWETRTNKGGNATRNRLLELSTGDWLQYLDADDYLLPNKIKDQVEFVSKYFQIDIAYSPVILEHHTRKKKERETLAIPKPHDPWVLLARWYLPQTGSPLWRKQAIIDVGKWKENQRCCQEHELYLRLLKAGKQFRYFAKSGAVYRQWSESTVCRKNKLETYRQRLKIVDTLEEHLQFTNQLTKPRQNAINQARFECARIIWLSDKKWAKNIVRQIRDRDLSFMPAGNYAPEIYRQMYKLFGFDLAERIAALKRQLVTH